MGQMTGIAWTDSTFNGWIGCDKISPGCSNCYAEVSTPSRVHGVVWGPNTERHRTGTVTWRAPKRWNENARAFMDEHGHRQRVFCSSLADVFDNAVPPGWRTDLFKLIRDTPHLDWQILTKRIGNAKAMLPKDWGDGYPNVWLGATVVTQEEFDRDIVKLDSTPAALRFLSMEPLLERVDLDYDWLWGAGSRNGVDWVIVGGESGPRAREFDLEWARVIVDACKGAGVPAFVKQLGARPVFHPRDPEDTDYSLGEFADRKGADPREWPPFLRVQQFPGDKA